MPVKCRKCGGDHFTSNCGKEKKQEVPKKNDSNRNDSNRNDSNRNDSNRNDSNRNDSNRNDSNRNNSNRNNSNRNDSNRNNSNRNNSNKTFDVKNKKRSRFRRPFDNDNSVKTFKVKINNLPRDLTLHNLNKIMIGWGRIGDIRLRQNRSTSYALIDFFDREARNYFIDAINGTPMGFMMLHVTK